MYKQYWVKFYNEADQNAYIMHKPYPSNIIKGYMMRDNITYEGVTVEELIADFEGAVDDYLQLCADKGIEPRKPYTGVLNVRLDPEIHSGAAMAASKSGITINAFIKNAVAKALGMAL